MRSVAGPHPRGQTPHANGTTAVSARRALRAQV